MDDDIPLPDYLKGKNNEPGQDEHLNRQDAEEKRTRREKAEEKEESVPISMRWLKEYEAKEPEREARKREQARAAAARERVYAEKRAAAAAQKARIAKAKPKLDALRQETRKSPSNAESHCRLAVQLLCTIPHFSGLESPSPEFWRSFGWERKTPEFPNTYKQPNHPALAILSEAEDHLNLALGVGLVNPLDRAKAYFLLYKISSGGHTFVSVFGDTVEGSHLKELAKGVIAETKKHLRRQPHDLEALQMQFAAYYWLRNKKGEGQAGQAIKQAEALAKAGFLSPGNRTPNQTKKSPVAQGHALEEKVRALLQNMGLAATTTRATADGGIDVEAYSTNPIFSGKYLVQCKDWSNPVGESVVRDLYGVVMAENANKGILITTGRFTAAAERFAANKQLELIDGSALQTLLRKHGLL